MGKIIDLTGQKFGKLTAIEIDRTNKKNNTYWLCKCDCGNVKSVTSGNLRLGKTKSCGCITKQLQRDARIKDLTGQRFGRCIVIAQSDKDHITKGGKRRIKWLCRCDCGKYFETTSSNLVNGDTKSCGCYRDEQKVINGGSKFIDLTNKKIGLLTVIKRGEDYISPVGKHTPRWLCKCDCGTMKLVESTKLLRNTVLSCGCLNSKGEKIISEVLSKHNIPYFREYSFTNKKMLKYRFDFALHNNGKPILLIEYDGEQHFKPIRFNKCTEEQAIHNFREIQKRDKIKDDFCKENNIKLVRIPYTQYDKLETIIESEIIAEYENLLEVA